jgi:L-seryl-tRNA(Ser) seleniumtransferase
MGVTAAINALGVYTDLSGSRPSERVWTAMTAASDSFVSIPSLLDSTGQIIAGWLGTQAARVTGGASPAIVMAAGACMTGGSERRMEQLSGTVPLETVAELAHSREYRSSSTPPISIFPWS